MASTNTSRNIQLEVLDVLNGGKAVTFKVSKQSHTGWDFHTKKDGTKAYQYYAPNGWILISNNSPSANLVTYFQIELRGVYSQYHDTQVTVTWNEYKEICRAVNDYNAHWGSSTKAVLPIVNKKLAPTTGGGTIKKIPSSRIPPMTVNRPKPKRRRATGWDKRYTL